MKALITSFLSGLIFLTLSSSIYAQSVGNYSVSRNTAIPYNSIISTGQSFSSWRYTGGFSEDDNRSELTDIGFDFWYNGTRYTQFSVSVNGFIDFSSSTDDGGPQCDDYGYCNTNFTSSTLANGTWLSLAPFYDDMTTRAGDDPLGTSIKYQLDGVAPNRTLTVEWDAMAVYNNTSPDLNFQVSLHESTGVITYNYETMTSGTNTFSYTIGINAATLSATPSTAELLTQQTANSTTFSNTTQNNLSAMPAANSQLSFTPLTPGNPIGVLSFTNITTNAMTLNWSDWATNEVGYVIYSSTDDINYFFNTQTAPNATSSLISDLLPGTTYYWHVYAVTEGGLSTALNGNATTLPPQLITSITSGRWDRTGTWDCACIPNAGANVLIQDTHLITMRSTNEACNDLTIGQGASGELRIGRNNPTTYDLTINGNTLINTGAIMQSRTNSNTTHTLNIRGDITNNGTFDMQTDGDSFTLVNFTKTDGDQSVSGSGVTTNFYTINLSKGLKSNILDISSTVFTCDSDALTIVDGGTFQFSSAGSNSFSLYNSPKDIPMKGSIIMNSGNSIMSFGTGIDLRGDLTLTSGTINIGDATDENINSFGGALTINGGILNLAGRYDRNDSEETFHFVINAGTFALPTIGSTSTTRAPFDIDVLGSSFNMTGGTIIIERAGGTNLGYINTGNSTGNITGGTLQIGNINTPVSQTIQVNSSEPVANLETNSGNVTAQLTSNNLDVINDVTLTLGVLDLNNQNIILGGNWLVTGGSHNNNTGEAIFNGSAQSITSNGSTFNNITLSGSATKTFQDDLMANGNLTINSSMVLAQTGFTGAIGGDFENNGTFTRNDEVITFNGTADQNIMGSSTTDFTNITVNKTGGRVLIESTVNLAQHLAIETVTEFDADGAANSEIFSLLSSASEESNVGILPAGAQVSGTLRAEKYLPVDGTRRWRFIASTVAGATVSDLQNEIPISGAFTGSDNGTGDIPVNATGSLSYYDNSIGTVDQTLDDRWVLYPTTDNNALLTTTGTEARGYTIYIRDLTAVTYDLTGTLNQGTIDYTPSGNFERWNLLANPYPSTIDWDAAAGWTKAGIQGNAIHVWDGLQYLSWNGTIGSLGNGLIAKGTSFFIEGNAPSMTLISTENVKSTSSAVTHKSNNSPTYIELAISDSKHTDRAFIQFATGASLSLDSLDVSKLTNAIFNISTLSQDQIDLSINAINKADCNSDIPLNIYYINPGSYQLDWKNISSLQGLVDVQLFDAFNNASYNLNADDNLLFEVTNDPNSYGDNRFRLTFNSIDMMGSTATIDGSACESGQINIHIDNSALEVEYEVFNNDLLLFTALGTGDDLLLNIGKDSLEIGANSLKVIGINSFCGQQTTLVEKTFDHISSPAITYDQVTGILTTPAQEQLQWYKDDLPIGTLGMSSISLIDETATYYVVVQNESCLLTSEKFNYTAIGNSLTTFAIGPCDTAYAQFGIKNTQVGIVYQIIQHEEVLLSSIGNGEDLLWQLPVDSLVVGLNTFEVKAINNRGEEKYLSPISFTHILVPTITYDVDNSLLMTNLQEGLQWFKNNLPIGEIGSTFIEIDESSASYQVSLFSAGCTLTSAPFIFETITSLSSGSKDYGINIYPNPMQDYLQIALTTSGDTISGQIINSSGLIVKNIGQIKQSATIDVSILPAGIYFLKLMQEDSNLVFKLIKED
jgi:hypothetical protein